MGTAICGGSAIAAVAPVAKADSAQTTVALGTIFLLNAIGLFIFPPLGHFFGLTQEQFGFWAAIAVHDTSSVVGCASVYGDTALNIATTVKLTRTLWIIPLVFLSMFLFNNKDGKVYKPWFILFFISAILVNSFVSLPEFTPVLIVDVAKRCLGATLFLIGVSLSPSAIKEVGVKPLLLGILLWILIAIISLIAVMI